MPRTARLCLYSLPYFSKIIDFSDLSNLKVLLGDLPVVGESLYNGFDYDGLFIPAPAGWCGKEARRLLWSKALL